MSGAGLALSRVFRGGVVSASLVFGKIHGVRNSRTRAFFAAVAYSAQS